MIDETSKHSIKLGSLLMHVFSPIFILYNVKQEFSTRSWGLLPNMQDVAYMGAHTVYTGFCPRRSGPRSPSKYQHMLMLSDSDQCSHVIDQ